jgi:hypothetical protein
MITCSYFSQLFARWEIIRHILVLLWWLMDAAVQNEFVSLSPRLVGNNMFWDVGG